MFLRREYHTEATRISSSWCPAAHQKILNQLPEHIDATGGPLVTDYLYAAVTLPAEAAAAIATAAAAAAAAGGGSEGGGGMMFTANDRPAVGGPLGGLSRMDGFLNGVWFEAAPGYPARLPSSMLASTPSAGHVANETSIKARDDNNVLTLRMSIGGLPNYLWSNSLCKKDECDGPWDSHL